MLPLGTEGPGREKDGRPAPRVKGNAKDKIQQFV